eukprot:COSAG06_NODE_9426_length_1905_cov_1.225360_1_plen_239_part_00
MCPESIAPTLALLRLNEPFEYQKAVALEPADLVGRQSSGRVRQPVGGWRVVLPVSQSGRVAAVSVRRSWHRARGTQGLGELAVGYRKGLDGQADRRHPYVALARHAAVRDGNGRRRRQPGASTKVYGTSHASGHAPQCPGRKFDAISSRGSSSSSACNAAGTGGQGAANARNKNGKPYRMKLSCALYLTESPCPLLACALQPSPRDKLTSRRQRLRRVLDHRHTLRPTGHDQRDNGRG